MSHLHHKVSALIDGELSPHARDRALAHARRCSACREEIAQTFAVKQRLLGLPPAEPSADLVTMVASVDPTSLEPGTGRSSHPLRRLLLSVGPLSAAVLGLAYVVGAPHPPPQNVVSPPVDELSAEFADTAGAAPLADPAVGALVDTFEPAALTVAAPVHGRAPSYSSSNGSMPPVADSARAVRLLHEAATADDRIAYAGRRQIRAVEADGSITAAVEVRHVPGQGTSLRMLGAGRGSTDRFVAPPEGVAGPLHSGLLELLIDRFDVAVAGHDVVAGRPTTVVTATRGDRDLVKFWVDDAMGLLMRRDIYSDGRLVRSSAFTDLHTSHQGFLQHLPPELEDPATTALSITMAPALDDEGWSCPTHFGRFALTSLQQVDAGGAMVHASYSDGVSTLSVFEQHGTLNEANLDNFTAQSAGDVTTYVRDGIPSVTVFEYGDTVYTVLTDAPSGLAPRVVSALPHPTTDEPSVSGRLGTGLTRIEDFLNPMD